MQRNRYTDLWFWGTWLQNQEQMQSCLSPICVFRGLTYLITVLLFLSRHCLSMQVSLFKKKQAVWKTNLPSLTCPLPGVPLHQTFPLPAQPLRVHPSRSANSVFSARCLPCCWFREIAASTGCFSSLVFLIYSHHQTSRSFLFFLLLFILQFFPCLLSLPADP